MSGIVVPEHFIQATRDSGYRGLAFALAEIVDNALDAGASEVDIRIDEDRQEDGREITISVLDNGHGMDKEALRESLRFGGSERFGGRGTLGRYGMGLPNSSVSQAPRVDVFTWRKGRYPLRVYLDVEEIAGKGITEVPEPVPANLPDWISDRPISGTLVLWSRCDRLRYKMASTIARKLRPVLGRMYRISLSNGLVIRVCGEPLSPVDPLFREPIDGLLGTSVPYGNPLQYRIKTSTGTSLLTVQFVELPVSKWHELPIERKRTAGIVGGAGLSVLRAGREIDYGWHLFGGKRRENYDDWWRAELRFQPKLDEVVGITHTKQGINPTTELRGILEPDLERIARALNARTRQAFHRVRPTPASDAAERASARDRFLPPVKTARPARRTAAGGFQFQIGTHEEVTPEFFRLQAKGQIVQLDINRNHPFYQKLYGKRTADSDVEMLLLAAARALLDVPEETRRMLLRSWSDNLFAFLAK